MKICIGVDIGGTDTKIGAFAVDGTMLRKWKIATDITGNGERIIPNIAQSIHMYMRDRDAEDEIISIGAGIPGPVDLNGYVAKCVDLFWYDINPVVELQAFFPNVRICATNDANVAALGEYWYGAGQKYSSLMLVTLGTGVGGGIILKDRLLLGAHGLAGEIGHIGIAFDETEACNCGNHGCIDQYASATGIVRIMKRIAEEHPEQKAQWENASAADICAAAGEGNPFALQCLDICMGVLGRGLAYFSHAFDPEIIVIGGGVSNAGDVILEPIRRHYQEQLHLIDHGADIAISTLRNDAGIVGAFALAAKETEFI